MLVDPLYAMLKTSRNAHSPLNWCSFDSLHQYHRLILSTNKSSPVAEMGDRLATIDMGRKAGGGLLCHFFRGGGAGFPCNTMWPGLRPTPVPSGILIHAAIWPQKYRPKIGAVPLRGRRSWSPSNTICLGSRPTCVLIFILIHPTVWPQCTNVTDRQTGQDNGPIA